MKQYFKEITKNKNSDDLVKGNLALVVYIAKSKQGLGVPFTDLIAEGNIGLVVAAEKYDPVLYPGVGFGTFAYKWINAYVLASLEYYREIHIPANQLIQEKKETGSYKLERTVELDRPLDGDGRTVGDFYASESANNDMKDHIRDILYDAEFDDPRAEEMIRCIYGIDMDWPMSLADVALKFDVTKSRVSQIVTGAVRKLSKELA